MNPEFSPVLSEALIADPVISDHPVSGYPPPPWNSADLLELPGPEGGRFALGLAHSDRCVDAALRLRYEVFNLELNEGLESSALSGLDRDPFDAQMTHLILFDRPSGRIVGTYRLQTAREAQAALGLYSAGEYELDPLEIIADELVECGRACIAKDFRNLSTITLVWQGIAHLMKLRRQRYLFGCCSLTSQDPDQGWRAMKTIRKNGHLHHDFHLRAIPSCRCGEPSREFAADLGSPIVLPKLFRAYMHLGARVISEPAIDRAFGTVDFLVLLDCSTLTFSTLKAIL